MGKTDIYGFEYLEPYQQTQSVIDADEQRFRAIESQTYVLYSIFGNGIILEEGSTTINWEIGLSSTATNDAPSVDISAGRGHVSFMAAYTADITNVPLTLLTGTVKFYIYAIKTDTTHYDGSVEFVASTTVINTPNDYIGLGAVELSTASDGSISYVFYNDSDNGRVEISLFATIGNLINKHLHIGGNYNPPPIDLGHHVQGKLSGDNIDNLDLSKVTLGTISAERLPTIDHNSLTRRGILTHPQIDTLLTSLASENTDGRLSDLTTANMLQIAIALKRSLSYDSDKNLINALIYVPGLNSASGFIDRYFTNHENSGFNVIAPFVPREIIVADFDPINHQISASATGITTSNNMTWYTYFDFDKVKSTEENNFGVIDLDIVSASGVNNAYLQLAKPLRYTGVATEDLSNWDWSYKITDGSSGYTVSNPDIFKDQFDVERYFYLEFASEDTTHPTKDINGASKLDLFYRIPSISGQPTYPGNIYFYLMFSKSYTSTTSVTLPDKTIYISNMVQFRADTDALNTILGASIDITAFGNLTTNQKKDITGIGICYKSITDWDKQGVWFELISPTISQITDTRLISWRRDTPDLSSVYLWNDSLYESSETIRFRFNSGYINTQYQNVYATTTVDSGITDIKIYTAIANTTAELLSSTASQISNIGAITNSSTQNNRKYIDIIVTFTTNDLYKTPKLFSLTLNYSGPGSSQSPKIWDIGKEWNEGTLSNLDINGEVLLDERRPARIYAASGYNIYSASGFYTSLYDAYNNVTLQSGDRVLVNQSSLKTHNGIYKVDNVNASTAYLFRDDDANTANGFNNKFFLTINAGNAAHVGRTYNLKTIITTLMADDIEFELYNNSLTISAAESAKIGQYIFIKGNNTYYSGEDEVLHDYITGDNLYLSPYQLFNRLEPGFINPRFMTTLTNGNTLIVDTDNDRIIELTSANVVVKAIQGNIRLHKTDRDFVILSAIYNETLGILWIMFSQYISAAVDKTKMSIGNGVDTIVFSAQDTTTGIAINAIPMNSTSNQSATLVVEFPSTFTTQINSWITLAQTIQLTIDSSAVVCAGSDLTNATTSTSTPAVLVPTISPYLSGPPIKFGYIAQSGYGDITTDLTGEIKRIAIGDEFVGIPAESTLPIDNGDFNNDGEISNSSASILMGTDSMTGRITITVTTGDIIVDNIYSPIYAQEDTDSNWIISCIGEYNVVSYDVNLSTNWYIAATTVGFREDIDGSAWQMSNKQIVVALPAPIDSTEENANGEVVILNRNAGTVSNPQVAVVTRFSINRGDAIRAIPDTLETGFWVAVNDRVGNGLNSRIIKIDYSGKTLWDWGTASNAKIYNPTDLKILTNNTILVSE